MFSVRNNHKMKILTSSRLTKAKRDRKTDLFKYLYFSYEIIVITAQYYCQVPFVMTLF